MDDIAGDVSTIFAVGGRTLDRIDGHTLVPVLGRSERNGDVEFVSPWSVAPTSVIRDVTHRRSRRPSASTAAGNKLAVGGPLRRQGAR